MEINHSLVPSCFRFKPTDQELIGRFLRYFLVETPWLLPPPPHRTFMHKCNLFGNHSEPSEIWEAFGGGGLQLAGADQPALYFFSELTKKTPKGSNIVRKMGRNGGKWDGKAVPAWVEGTDGTDGTSTCIGLKRTFCYKNVCTEDHGAWLLDEYSLFAAPRKRKSHTSYDFDYVLCRLRKTSDNNKRKCPSSSSEDDQVAASTKNSINKRKCPTSSSSEDQVTTSNKRTKKKSANEEIKGDNDQELPMPADFGIAADGAVEENVWDPSLLEKYLLETHEEEPLNPSFYNEWIAADGGGVQEAYNPNAYENVQDQSYYGSSYPKNACLGNQFMPPINIAQEIL